MPQSLDQLAPLLARKLALLAVRTESAVVVGDARGTVEWVNDAWSRMTGHAPSQAIGKPMVALFEESEIDEVAAEFIRTRLAAHEAARLELELSDRRGGRRWVDLEVLPTPGEEGEATSFIAVATDITERKEAEKALVESEARYRTLVEQCPNPVAVHREGRIVYVNPAAVTLWGGTDAKELVGRSVLELIHPDWRPLAEQRIRAMVERGVTPEVIEGKVFRRDGSVAHVLVHAARLLLDGKPAVQVLLVDVSEQARRRDEERRQAEHARDAEVAARTEGLASGFATRLEALSKDLVESCDQAWIEMPAASPLPSLRRLRRAALGTAALTGQLEVLAGRVRPRPVPLDLSAFVLRLSTELDSEFGERATIAYDLAGALPPAYADAEDVRLALWSLTENAAEAAAGARGGIRIRTGLVEADAAYLEAARPREGLTPGSYLALEVRDGGPGMKPETLARLFEPFYSTKGAGRGMGLVTALRRIEAQGGGIRAESVIRRGTTLTILLPAASRAARS